MGSVAGLFAEGRGALNVIDYLASKGHHGKRAAGPEYAFACFFTCNEPPDSKKKKLYVNSDDGYYDCKVCGEKGGTTLLRRHFGDDEEDSPALDSSVRRRLLGGATDVAVEMLANNDRLLEYLIVERGLSASTIMERRLGCITGSWSLVKNLEATKAELAQTGLVHREGPRAGQDFFFDHLLIPYQVHGTVVQLRGRSLRDGGPKYVTGPGEEVRLYNADDLIGAERVIITEGEFDCIKLVQELQASPEDHVRAIAVVAVPGTGALPAGFETYFEHAKRVYVAFDGDEAGEKGAAKVMELLGSKARKVSMPPGWDWTDFFLKGGYDWRGAVDLLREADRSARRLSNYGEARESLNERRHADPGLRTGFRGFDATIEPGMLPGQVFIALAKTGTGKTLFLCNLIYNMCDQPILLVTLEMTREEIIERLQRVFYFHHPRGTDADEQRAFSRLMICDENRLAEADLEQLVAEFIEEVGEPPKVLMVDYLGYYARGFPGGTSYEKTSNAAMQLKAEAKKHRFVVITPAQVNRLSKEGKPIEGDGARDSGVVEETADFLVALWRPDDALTEESQAEPSGKLKMEILKSRHGGKGRVFTLQMDLAYLAIVDDNTDAAARAKQHNYLHWRSVPFHQMRADESAPIQSRLDAAGGNQ